MRKGIDASWSVVYTLLGSPRLPSQQHQVDGILEPAVSFPSSAGSGQNPQPPFVLLWVMSPLEYRPMPVFGGPRWDTMAEIPVMQVLANWLGSRVRSCELRVHWSLVFFIIRGLLNLFHFCPFSYSQFIMGDSSRDKLSMTGGVFPPPCISSPLFDATWYDTVALWLFFDLERISIKRSLKPFM